MEDADNGPLFQSQNLAFRHCRSRRHAPRLPGQATFAAEFIRPQDGDDGFLPLLGNDGDFDLAALNEENRISRIALPVDNLICPVFGFGSSAVHFREKHFRVETEASFGFHSGPS
jgi:hypothetical protein